MRRDDLNELQLSDATTGETLSNVSPEEVFKLEFMEPPWRSALARTGAPAKQVTEIVNGEPAVPAEIAILLGLRLGTGAEFWLNLQMAHDLEEARRRMAAAV